MESVFLWFVVPACASRYACNAVQYRVSAWTRDDTRVLIAETVVCILLPQRLEEEEPLPWAAVQQKPAGSDRARGRPS